MEVKSIFSQVIKKDNKPSLTITNKKGVSKLKQMFWKKEKSKTKFEDYTHTSKFTEKFLNRLA